MEYPRIRGIYPHSGFPHRKNYSGFTANFTGTNEPYYNLSSNTAREHFFIFTPLNIYTACLFPGTAGIY